MYCEEFLIIYISGIYHLLRIAIPAECLITGRVYVLMVWIIFLQLSWPLSICFTLLRYLAVADLFGCLFPLEKAPSVLTTSLAATIWPHFSRMNPQCLHCRSWGVDQAVDVLFTLSVQLDVIHL